MTTECTYGRADGWKDEYIDISINHSFLDCPVVSNICQKGSFHTTQIIDWLQSLKHFFINVSYHILVASLTLMALFLAPVLKTIFHECVISFTCIQSNSDGSVLKQSHQS